MSRSDISEDESDHEQGRRPRSIRKMGRTHRNRDQSRSRSRERQSAVAAVQAHTKEPTPEVLATLSKVSEAMTSLTDGFMKLDTRLERLESNRPNLGDRLSQAPRPRSPYQQVRFREGPPSCWNCGVLGHISQDCNVRWCNVCHREGHVARDCRSNPGQQRDNAHNGSYQSQSPRRPGNSANRDVWENEQGRGSEGRDKGHGRE